MFGRDGALRAAPGFREVESFHREDYPLVELPCQTWHGWVFVNATGEAAPFPEYVGALAGIVAPYRPETLHLLARHSYDVAANWKVVCENYRLAGAWVGGSMRLRSETMSLTGRSGGYRLPAAPAGRVEYLGLVPNLLLSLRLPRYPPALSGDPMTVALTPTLPVLWSPWGSICPVCGATRQAKSREGRVS